MSLTLTAEDDGDITRHPLLADADAPQAQADIPARGASPEDLDLVGIAELVDEIDRNLDDPKQERWMTALREHGTAWTTPDDRAAAALYGIAVAADDLRALPALWLTQARRILPSPQPARPEIARMRGVSAAGYLIRRWRRAHEVTLLGMAEMIQTSPAAISALETGRAACDAALLEKIGDLMFEAGA